MGAVFGADSPLEALPADVLDAAIAGMTAAGGGGSLQRPEATLNRYRSTFRAFFRWAFETGRIPRNPAIRLHLAWVDSPPTPPITPRETRLFLSAIRRSDDPLRLRDEALFSTYALTGLRRSEALCLDVSDYDAKEKSLRVKDGKGRRVRTVPVVQPLGLLLERFRDGVWPQGDRTREKLFPGRIPGRGLTNRQAHARFQRWKAAAALRLELTIHSFRALGHRDLRPTLRYVELCAGKLLEAMERSFAGAV